MKKFTDNIGIDKVNFLSEAEVRSLYYWSMGDYGGLKSVSDQGKLESSISEPKTTYGYTEDIYQTAAAYGYFFCKNHVFGDGNKRVAYTTMRAFLLKNGYDIIATEEEKMEIMLQVAKSQMDKNGLAVWLQQHIKIL